MDITILSTWAQVAASVAVLATLVYLSIQIKQNVAMLQSESRRTLVENDRAAMLAFLENRDLMEALHNGDELSYQDQFRFSLMWLLDMRNREYEYFQYQAGVLDEAAWRSYQETIHLSFGRPRYRKWWEKVGRSATSPEFSKMVDGLIAGRPENSILEDLGTWDD